MAEEKTQSVFDKSETIKNISERREKLHQAGENLKSYFVGLDDVIDKIVKHMEVWYVMPQLLTRPCIVNLWGMTGVGKTDLVRRLIKEIGFNENFLEVQMTNEGSSSHPYSSTMNRILSYSNIDPQDPGVILLDEMQRFRTVDEEGREIHDYKLQDVWMLLSDGRFANDASNKNNMYEMLFDILYEKDEEDARAKAEEKHGKPKKAKKAKSGKSVPEDDDDDEDEELLDEETKKHRKFKRSYWSAKSFKGVCRLDMPIEEIMQLSSDRKLEILQERIEDQSAYEGDDYSKMLIFISGNLDEAYSMAEDADEADVDADLFHKHSKRINMLSIKKALKKRFKPEQIARLGNSHVIYPSLSRLNYEELIRRKIDSVVSNVEEEFKVNCQIESSIHEAIYDNGVFPVQGTRPLFSTISSFFEAALPRFVLKALSDDVEELTVFYQDDQICAQIGDYCYKIKNEGELDRIKRKTFDADSHVSTSVHEAGHAIVYTMLTGLAPTQIVVNSSSPEKKGFVYMHNIDNNKTSMESKICTFMGGRAAEAVVFGEDLITSGASKDISMATAHAATMIRQLAMSKWTAKTTIPYFGQGCSDPNLASNDLDATNVQIDEAVSQGLKKATTIIKQNLELFKELCDILIKNIYISEEEYMALCIKHGVECRIYDAENTVYDNYVKKYEETFGTIGKIATYEDMKKMRVEQAIKNAHKGLPDKNKKTIAKSPKRFSHAASDRRP